MKWYKHMTNTDTSGLVTELVDVMGINGYGIWFRLLEVIGAKCEHPNWETSLRLTVAGWRRRLYCTDKDLKLFMETVRGYSQHDLDRDQEPPVIITQEGRYIEIQAPRLLDYADRYSADMRAGRIYPRKKRDKGGESGGPADHTLTMDGSVTDQSVISDRSDTVSRREEKRREKNRTGKDGGPGSAKTGIKKEAWNSLPDWLRSEYIRTFSFNDGYDYPHDITVSKLCAHLKQFPEAVLIEAFKRARASRARVYGWIDTRINDIHDEFKKAAREADQPDGEFSGVVFQ